MSKTKFTKGEWHWEHDESTASMIQVSCNSGSDVCRLQSEDNANLIVKAPKMYEMLESVASELYMLIDEVNDQRASRITSQTESEPDYHDMQTLHEIQYLLAEVRGDK